MKNKQSEKIEQATKKEVLADIPPLILTDFSAIRHFEEFGGGNDKTPENPSFSIENPKNFKSASKENQLKILYGYMLNKSDNGIYKREGGRQIAEHFGVSKDVIQDRFNELLERGLVIELKQMNRFYKIKEWSE